MKCLTCEKEIPRDDAVKHVARGHNLEIPFAPKNLSKLDFSTAEDAAEILGLPYHVNDEIAEAWLKIVVAWQKHPDNDCLRARGDSRWQKACELQSRFENLLKPF